MRDKLTIGDAIVKHMHDVQRVLGLYDLWMQADGNDELAKKLHTLRSDFATVHEAIASYVYDNNLHTKAVSLDDRSDASAYRYSVLLASCICTRAPVVSDEDLCEALGGK
jgi:hypothetical protein